MRKILMMVLLTTHAMPAVAQPDLNSGNAWVEPCRAALDKNNSQDPFSEGVCFGFVTGVFTTLAWPRNERICPPNEATVNQALRVIVYWLDQHPARLHENFHALAMVALTQAWPCKK